MKKVDRKNKKNNKKRHHTLYDFLPKAVINEFIEYKDDPEGKKEFEEACAELDEILEDFEDRLGRKMTKHEHKTLIAVIRKYSPKNKEGEVFTFLHPETIWELYWYERVNKWDLWEEFLK